MSEELKPCKCGKLPTIHIKSMRLPNGKFNGMHTGYKINCCNVSQEYVDNFNNRFLARDEAIKAWNECVNKQ